MDHKKTHDYHITKLPQDLLGQIVAKVGSADPEAYRNCMTTCKRLAASAHDERVCKALNLAPLVSKPLAVLQYLPVMKYCLEANNPDAHYIKGIIRYFLLDDSTMGLYHLRVAPNAGKKDAVYLYGVLKLCWDHVDEGKRYLSMLKWEEDATIVDSCWKSIKRSLYGIRVKRKGRYLVSLHKMKPHNYCHLSDMDTTCPDCFHYKIMKKLILMI